MNSLTTKNIKLTLHSAGYCLHPEFVTIKGGSFRPSKYPAGFATIRHPELGVILFDTGYSEHFFTETSRFPASIYARITPVRYQSRDSAANQLRIVGIEPNQVKFIILSHFHADHIAGLRDFPDAQLLYLPRAYDAVKNLRGLAALRAGYLPGLLPEDFEERSVPIQPKLVHPFPSDFPFEQGHDLFRDGSIIAVDISGHATGQIGLFVSTTSENYFLCADAAWSTRAIHEHRLPHPVSRLIMADSKAHDDSFERVHQLHQQYPSLQIVPSHCLDIWERYIQGDATL
ncbi:glyoxylase-like metal-dependent hydrolase (beta-lactamase superfamily II) [Paenibacillus sp. DS2015]|uniref:MBL fold metallo-hydrolase n=1 Tax=Paenibacillus sp. DS2015 TaxID=3373917 RepID=UPI003D1FD59C